MWASLTLAPRRLGTLTVIERERRWRGKPTDNAFIESFNGRLRDECLNAPWFLSLADAPLTFETTISVSG